MLTSPFLSEEITFEILARLPARDIARIRCVCKQWLSLTSKSSFIQYHYARNLQQCTAGFFLSDRMIGANYFLLNVKPPGLPDPSLSFIPIADNNEAQIFIETSCNGFIICYRTVKRSVRGSSYYVCNPNTREFVELPLPKEVNRHHLSLAFDPLKSPHYKVVDIDSQIYIYSSETRLWKLSMDNISLREFGGLRDDRSVYWNNSLIWIGMECLLSFNVDRECMSKLPEPPKAHEYTKVVYMGESGGKLQMVRRSKNEKYALFCILEMDLQGSGWSVLCEVDLESVKALYPVVQEREIWSTGVNLNIAWAGRNYLGFTPIYFIRNGDEGGGLLLLSLPGKVISYQIINKVFKEVCHLLPPTGPYCLHDWHKFFFLGHTLFSP